MHISSLSQLKTKLWFLLTWVELPVLLQRFRIPLKWKKVRKFECRSNKHLANNNNQQLHSRRCVWQSEKLHEMDKYCKEISDQRQKHL